MRHAAELEFLDLIERSPICRNKRISASLGEKFGIIIACAGKPLGIWGWLDGALRFRTLASWEPRISVADADAALVATIEMANAHFG